MNVNDINRECLQSIGDKARNHTRWWKRTLLIPAQLELLSRETLPL